MSMSIYAVTSAKMCTVVYNLYVATANAEWSLIAFASKLFFY